MIVIGLDISKHMGFAVIEDGKRIESGTYDVDAETLGFKNQDQKGRAIVDEYGYLCEGVVLGHYANALRLRHQADWIYLEQTNNGRNRTSQKQLEFLHAAILRVLADEGYSHKVRYVDTSAWRSVLKIKMSKDQRQHNKLVKAKKVRGKITTKHLAVAWANETFGLGLKLKDNNEADALAVAQYGLLEQTRTPIDTVDVANVATVFQSS